MPWTFCPPSCPGLANYCVGVTCTVFKQSQRGKCTAKLSFPETVQFRNLLNLKGLMLSHLWTGACNLEGKEPLCMMNQTSVAVWGN